MSTLPPSNEDENLRKLRAHQRGAIATWGLVIGGMVGGIAGLFFDLALVGAFFLSVIGWIVGAFIERARS